MEAIPTGEGLTFEKVWLMFQEMKLEAEKDRKEAEKERKRLDSKLDQKIAETNAIIGRLGNKLGEFVEGFVRPGIVRLFNERGIPITQTAQRLEATRNAQKMEVDIIGINGTDVIVVEVKSTLGVDDVKDYLDRLAQFKMFFPQYAEKHVIGAVAGRVIGVGVDKFAYRQGLFVIVQAGETVQLLNDLKFQPKHW